MKVLLLGPGDERLSSYLEAEGHDVETWAFPLEPDMLVLRGIEILVSYRYRYMISPFIIQRFPDGIVNLHISLLPWNRGADPNLWSFLENTSKGVTLHYVDEGLDTGDIIAQRAYTFDESSQTLATTYQELNDGLVALFQEWWPHWICGRAPRYAQPAGGSLHRSTDKEKYRHLLTHGWDTPVRELVGKAIKAMPS